MKDRDLLERAAKAAEHMIVDWTRDGNGVEVAVIVLGDGFSKRYWQPLLENQMTDADGDALRLAVELKFGLNTFHNADHAAVFPAPPSLTMLAYEPHNGDQRAATRLSIVRAAAKMAPGQQTAAQVQP